MNLMLIAVNVAIFTSYFLSSIGVLFAFDYAILIENWFVLVPSEILQRHSLITLVTSMFMHAGWLHLLGNMLFLFIFGDNVEDALGHGTYLLFYLIGGIVAAMAQIFASVLFLGALAVGIVGASGAISAVLGAYIVMYPKALILTWIVYVIIPLPAVIFLGLWFAVQWLYGFVDPLGGVAYFAHIGGFVMGMLVGATLGRKRKKEREKRLRY